MLSLPLQTLSTAQDTDASEQRFNWQKETNDLTLIIDSYGARGGLQLMKLCQGSQVRQTIEIERLINEGNHITRLSEERGVQVQPDHLHISAIVRCPLLAIKWQVANDKIRRIQMRFKSDKDFDTAFSHLLHLGLYMGGQKARPDTAMLFNRTGSASRPGTADHPGSTEILPPRRELPFPRLSSPRSSGSDSVRPSTGTMGPPPLPARVASNRPGSSRSATSKEIELPPLPQPTVISKTARGKQPMQQPPRTPNQDQYIPARAKTSPHGGIENQSPLTWSPISSPLSFNRSSFSAIPTPQPLGERSNAAQDLHHTMSYRGLDTPPTSVAGHCGVSMSNSGATTSVTENDQLATYAMQSDEGRRAALNEFVYRHLESDDFLTLVQDMETAWARVTMGTQ
ncbi:hypothetical protein J4E90_008198 [Alternaria incomplexa]|uniref:uncharacterized protein n=1 Tax=Alternaria incomplexa TaxID=1187928 RepID=UPI00221FF945|nr:uncharacterized protein J4E90_008198 [Alternaria incomplexa]KAI4909501.1 hypothetical protein J4E90_008198 [Alternaria incomplexa]